MVRTLRGFVFVALTLAFAIGASAPAMATADPAEPPVAPADPTVGWPELEAADSVVPPLQSGSLTSRMWDTNWGPLVFVSISADGSFRAAYTFRDGAIVGRLEGDVLVGWWCEATSRQPPSEAGEVQFRMVRTGTVDPVERLDGRWTFGLKDPATAWSPWRGTYLDEVPDPALVERGIAAAELCANPFSTIGTQRPLTLDAPSVLSGLTTVQSVTPVALAAAGGGAIVLVAIAAYPAILLDGTLESNRDRLFRWARAPAARLKRWGSGTRGRLPGWLSVALGLLGTLVISGFIDPRFGVNLGSVRMLVSLGISLVVERLLFLLIVRRLIARRVPELAPTVHFALSSLAFVVLAVILTRVTGFEPGIVFGLVLGLAVASDLSRVAEGRLALAAGGWALVLGLIGWLGYSLLVAFFGASPDVIPLFLQETFSGFAVSGIAALPIALLPVAVLDGGALWAWRKLVWLLAYVLGLTAFLIVVLPMPTSWAAVSGSWIWWISLYSGFCVLAIGVWALFRFVFKRNPDTAPESAASVR